MPLAHHCNYCSASSCEQKAARCVALGHLGQLLRQAAAPRRATARRAGRAVLCRAVPCRAFCEKPVQPACALSALGSRL